MTINDNNAIIARVLEKVELAIHRARQKYNDNMTAQVFAEAFAAELYRIIKEIEDGPKT